MERANLCLAEMRLDLLRLMDISNHRHELVMVPLRLPRMFLLPIANIRDQVDLQDQVSAY